MKLQNQGIPIFLKFQGFNPFFRLKNFTTEDHNERLER